ncbi:MAG: 16S rRNA (cytidine(1402)-2'-O)-methyltransferase [Acidobacteria bacterium]|nr:16S rRNA (cytidine(1402)-2'-O)-methyltransferase [Acidobacteriota bacterium]
MSPDTVSSKHGSLLVIATPLGNLSDLSQRAARAIAECDLLLCEDTRVTRKLISHLGARVELKSHHEHNEEEMLEFVLARLESGQTVGLVSDAGTPLLADPGFPLVRAARKRGFRVEPVPGPFAGVAALSASGIAPVPFCFLGFVPRKRSERKELFRSLPSLGMTSVVFESPHRVMGCLEDLENEHPGVEIVIARELTKIHEEILSGTVSELLEQLRSRDRIRGEITIVISAITREQSGSEDVGPDRLRAEFEELRSSGMKRTDAVKILSERYGLQRRELYDKLL